MKDTLTPVVPSKFITLIFNEKNFITEIKLKTDF